MNDWQADAACRDSPWELFFPSSDSVTENRRLAKEAIAICEGCPVRVECREFAQTSNRGQREQHGIWAGRDYEKKERKPYTKPTGPRTLSCAICGTRWRYTPKAGYRAPRTCSYVCSNELRARTNRETKRGRPELSPDKAPVVALDIHKPCDINYGCLEESSY